MFSFLFCCFIRSTGGDGIVSIGSMGGSEYQRLKKLQTDLELREIQLRETEETRKFNENKTTQKLTLFIEELKRRDKRVRAREEAVVKDKKVSPNKPYSNPI